MRGLKPPHSLTLGAQVEVKIRLPDRAAYDKLAAMLAADQTAAHEQENYFFDTPDSALNAKRTVLRLRFHDVDKAALITIKVREKGRFYMMMYHFYHTTSTSSCPLAPS